MLGPNLYNCVSHRDVWQDGARHIRIYDGTKKRTHSNTTKSERNNIKLKRKM
jgi:hypothetical protein